MATFVAGVGLGFSARRGAGFLLGPPVVQTWPFCGSTSLPLFFPLPPLFLSETTLLVLIKSRFAEIYCPRNCFIEYRDPSQIGDWGRFCRRFCHFLPHHSEIVKLSFATESATPLIVWVVVNMNLWSKKMFKVKIPSPDSRANIIVCWPRPL